MDTQTLAIIVLVVNLLIGIVFCFFGNRWLKLIVAVYGFLLGFMLAYTLLPMFASLSGILVLVISIGVGIVGALLFIFFLYLGIFFIGFGAGVILSLLIVEVLGINILDWYVYIPVLIIGCILGSLTLNKRRIFIAIFTAFIGASMLAIFIYQLINGATLNTIQIFNNEQAMQQVYTSTVYLVSLAALFIIGLVVQLTMTSKKQTGKRN